MKSVFVLSVLVLSLLSSTTCSLTKLNLKNLPKIEDNRILTDTSGTDGGNMTEYYDPDNKSSGISTGGIVAIAVPCIAALVGVGAAAAILGASAPAVPSALAPVATAVPPPTFVDTSVAQLAVPQPQIVQPVVQPEIIPQPVQQVIQPIPKVETPVINIPQQPIIAQPQMVPVQQMQLVPVQQVEMVPVQQVEMVPVQQIVPTYQAAAEVAPQITQASGAQISQGIQGGEFLTAPEGYGTSAIQTTTNPLNAGEFSTNNLM